MNILLIAPYSYPIFCPENNVNSKFVKALTNLGYHVDLVSALFYDDPTSYPVSEGKYLFSDVASLHCMKMRNPKNRLEDIREMLRFTLRTRILWHHAVAWANDALKQCERLIAERHYDYVMTKNAPSEVMGCYLSRKYDIKWISTWNDPFPLECFPPPYGIGYDHRLSVVSRLFLPKANRQAYMNFFPSAYLRNYMLAYMKIPMERTAVIPHIVMESMVAPRTPQPHETLRILHSGSTGRERNPKTLLQGLRMFLTSHPDADVELTFLGTELNVTAENSLDHYVAEYGLQEKIKRIKSVPYEQSLSIIAEYDLCMILEANCEVGIFMPTKVTDYAQCGKPIWAVSPAVGTLIDYYRRGEIDYFSDVTSAESVKAALEKIHSDFKAQGTLAARCPHSILSGTVQAQLKEILESGLKQS